MTKFQRTMCWLMSLILIYFTILVIWQSRVQCEYSGKAEPVFEIIEEKPQDLIERLVTEKGYSVETSLRIAECESQFGKYINNWSGSSAYGLYQFTNRTWKYYCSGDKDSYIDQTYCFINLHKKHQSWWECI